MGTLLDDIDQFLAVHKMGAATFGDLAMKDRHLVRQLRGGRRLWPETENKVRNFMAEYDPPVATPTPTPSEEEAAA